jgi:hypothetical protein
LSPIADGAQRLQLTFDLGDEHAADVLHARAR